MKDANGQIMLNPDGSVKTQQMSKKGMAASILAGALSSMVAGQAAGGPQYMGRGQGYKGVNSAAAFQAGQDTGDQFSTQNKVKQAQEVADKNKIRQYQTTKQNLDLHLQSLQVDRLGEEAQDKHLANFAPIVAAANTVKRQDGASWFREDGTRMDDDQMHAFLKANPDAVTNHSVVPVDKVPEYDADGKPTGRSKLLYSAFKNDGMIPMTKEIQDYYHLDGVQIGKDMPIQLLMQKAMDANDADVSKMSLENAVSKQQEFVGKDKKDTVAVDQKDLVKHFPNWAATVGKVRAGLPPDQFVSAVQDKDPNLGNYLAGKMHIDFYEANKQRVSDTEAAANKKTLDLKKAEQDLEASTPEGKAKLQKVQLENQTLQDSLDQARLNAAGVNPPPGFVVKPEYATMEAPALRQALQAQGVKIPAKFDALVGVAHNESPLEKDFPTRTTAKSGQMDAGTAVSYIRQNIYPHYNENDFKAAQALDTEVASTKSGAGYSLMAAGTAAQHLQMLDQAITALHNGNLQPLNSLAQEYSRITGSKVPVEFDAVADQVNMEVAKVVSGGTPHVAETDKMRTNLSVKASPDQNHGVIGKYIGLMNGRLTNINSRYRQYFNRDVKGIDDTTRNVFAQYGYTAPGTQTIARSSATGSENAAPAAPMTATNKTTGAKVISNDGGKTWQPAPTQ